MKKLFLILLMVILTSALIFTACAQQTPTSSNPSTAPTVGSTAKPTTNTQATSSKPIELVLNMTVPSTDNRWVAAIGPWCKEVEKETNGKVKITPNFAGAISAPPGVYDSVITGIADMAEGSVNFIPAGRAPMMNSFLDCTLAGTYPKGLNLMELYNKFPSLQNELKDVKVLFLDKPAPSEFGTCKQPLKTPEDLKGLKMGAISGEVAIAKMNALGVSVEKISPNDLYMALQKGVVDGSETPYDLLEACKLSDNIKYMTAGVPISGGTPFYMIMNWGKWNSLPPDIQKVFEDLSGEYAQNLYADFWWNGMIAIHKQFTEQGGNSYQWSSENIAKVNDIWKPVIQKWITGMNAKGYPAQDIVQAYWQLADKYKTPYPF